MGHTHTNHLRPWRHSSTSGRAMQARECLRTKGNKMRLALQSRPYSGTRLFVPVHHFSFAPQPIRVTRVFRCCAGAAAPEPGPRWRILAAAITWIMDLQELRELTETMKVGHPRELVGQSNAAAGQPP